MLWLEQPIRQVLLALLRDEDPPGLSARTRGWGKEEWAGLLAEAQRQRVVGVVFDALRASDMPARMAASSRAAFEQATGTVARRVLRLHGELAAFLDAFATAGIPVIPLKGAYLATSVYRDLALRDMGDIDLLVPVEHLQHAASITAHLGYEPKQPFSVKAAQSVANHLPRCTRRGGGSVEVHWNLVAPRRVVSMAPEELWQRSLPAVVLGRSVRALCPEDLALHLCVHTSYQHLFGFGLRSLYDLRAVVKSPGHRIDWDRMCARARVWHGERGTFLALQLARDLLHAPVPETVLDALRPSALDPAAVECAARQLFTDPSDVYALRGEIARLAGSQSLRSRWRHVRERVFLDRVELAALSGVAPEMSPFRQLSLYARRLLYLLRRYTRPALEMSGGATPAGDIAIRQQFLREWLAG